MKKYVVVLFVSLFSSAGEFETSVGFGHQFGGLLGAQYGYKTEKSKYYGSLGLVGFAVGFQTTFSENSKHAFGLTMGAEELQSEDGFGFITYDYHLKGFSSNGWVIGAGIGTTRQDEGGWFSDSGKIETNSSVTLNVGYKF